MAAKMLLSPPSHPLSSLPFPSNKGFTLHPWLGWQQHQPRPKKLLLHVSLHDPLSLSSSSSALVDYIAQQNSHSLVLLAESVGYSLASYYTSLGLFVISVPGLWSLIKRSVKSKVIHSPCLHFFFVFNHATCLSFWVEFWYSLKFFPRLTPCVKKALI